MTIKSFKNGCAEDIFNSKESKDSRKLPQYLRENAIEKLDMINAAVHLTDLKVPPGNKLERLFGNLDGFWSIRINNQWRIIFQWHDGDAEDVAICDYH